MLLLVKGFILSYNNFMRLEEKVAALFIAKKKTLAIAESCTGGFLADHLTNIPGSSRFFRLGCIAYSNEAKTKLLKVPVSTLRKYGAVSAPAAVAMAANIRRILKTDFGVGVTGIAGPAGAAPRKPIGLTYIAIKTACESLCVQCRFKGKRTSIKSQVARQTFRLLLEFL